VSKSATALVHTLFDSGSATGLTDGQLLQRFAARQFDGPAAEAAFAALVHRHGMMVLRVCRRVLGDTHDAHDASQAVFLILARKAGAGAGVILQQESVGGWLHGVALRVARKARVAAARRRAHERRGAIRDEPCVEKTWDDSAALLHEEIDRLPEKYRAPILLCHLEDLTNEQAAQRLRWPLGTVQTRLARGRKRLRDRLVRRGVDPSLVWALPTGAGACVNAVPVRWVESMVRTVLAGEVSASAFALMKGVSRAMMIPKLKAATATLLILAVAAAVGASRPGNPEAKAEPGPSFSPTPQEKKAKDKPEATRELKRDDGKSAGKRSIAGGGHAVMFESPGEGWTLTAVRLHGSRYGYPKAPDEDFKIYLCDEKFHKLATFPFPYATFERGEPKWVTLKVKPTAVPAKFFLCADFNPTGTKGVYVHHDAEAAKTPTSFVGLPDDGEPQPFSKGDWLIRAELAPPADAAKR
jgi:RNA polymerase sigma factor (sigma-70 family)